MVERLWPNALAALEWIDDYGDLDGDGFVEYRAPVAARSAQPGLEGFGRCDPPHATAARRGPDRAGRGPGLRLRRPRGDGPAGAASRRDAALADRLDVRPDDAPATFDDRVLGARRRASTRWPSTAPSARCATIDVERRDRPSGPGSSRPGRAAGRRAAARAGHVLAAGASGRTRPASPATTRSGTTPGPIWPHDNALIARGPQGRPVHRRREPARRPR